MAPPTDKPASTLRVICDGCAAWSRYTLLIQLYANGEFPMYTPLPDPVICEVIQDNLMRVRAALWSRREPGVVRKIKQVRSDSTGDYWREFDHYLLERARHAGFHPWKMPVKAATFTMQRSAFEAATQVGGRYVHTSKADMHHIWPEAFEGPTVGWNMVPLHPSFHHDRLHPVIDELLRCTADGELIRLI